MRDGRSSLTDKWPQLPTSCDRCNGDPPYGAIVFKSVFWNTDQIKLEPYSIIQLTNNLFCTSEFEEQSWENMIEYLKGSAKSTMSGQSIGYTGPQVSSEWDFWSVKGSITPPSNSASSWSKQLARPLASLARLLFEIIHSHPLAHFGTTLAVVRASF